MEKQKMLVIVHQVDLGDTYCVAHTAESLEEAIALLDEKATGRGDGRGSYPYYVDVIRVGEEIYIPANLDENEMITTEYEPY